MKLLFIVFAISVSLFSQTPFPGGGGSSAGTNVTVAAPYITIGGTKYVAQTLFPFTAFFSGSFLDANTCTLTAATNGSELISCALVTANAWYSVAATTSIESEFVSGSAIAIPNGTTVTGGIWICDSTNGKLYTIDVITVANTATANGTVLQTTSWTLAGCIGTPSAATLRVGPIALPTVSLAHVKLVKSGANLLFQLSMDGGQTFTQLDSLAVGTLSKAGYQVRATGTTTAILTALSTVVN